MISPYGISNEIAEPLFQFSLKSEYALGDDLPVVIDPDK